MNSTVIFFVFYCGIILLIIGGVVVFLLMSRPQKAVTDRLDRFTGQEQVTAAGPAINKETVARASVFGEELSKALTRRKWGEDTARELARADVKLNIGEYMALHVIIGGAGAAGAWFIGGGPGGGGIAIVLGLIGLIASLFVPRMYVGFLKGQRLQKFDNQLGDMLNLVVNGLRAGYSVMQALEAVGKELPAPISTEFRRVVQEMQLGIPMEAALANLTRRIPSKDLDFVVTAINVQREVGGNLAEILDSISFTIRERVRIKGEISTLTAQGMMTGYVISLLPIGLAIFLTLVNPNYMLAPFKNDYTGGPWCGICMGVGALVLIGTGFAAVMKIVQIEV